MMVTWLLLELWRLEMGFGFCNEVCGSCGLIFGIDVKASLEFG